MKQDTRKEMRAKFEEWATENSLDAEDRILYWLCFCAGCSAGFEKAKEILSEMLK